MGYDSMAAWDRQSCDVKNNNIWTMATPPYELDYDPIELAILMARSGSTYRRTSPFIRYRRRPLSQTSTVPPTPTSPTSPPASSDGAPSFKQAKAQWSPPPSPRTLSLKGSPRSSPRVDSPQQTHSSPCSSPTPRHQTNLASKLYAAATAGDLKHIRFLLSLGAPINTPTLVQNLYDGFRPAKPGCLSTLAGAASHGHLGAVKLLLAHGAALNPTMQQSSSSPLHQAIKADDIELAAFLLEYGADVNILNCFNSTPLMYAARYSSPALVSLILNYNPDLHKRSFIGTAAIHMAFWPGNEEVMELLLRASADPDAAMGDGSTPLHLAALGDLPGVAKVLVKFGAKVGKRNEEGRTAVQVAREKGYGEVVGVLEEAEEESRTRRA
ncbi:hypothetical protein LTR37_000915 [Vermiconidia calcicola]|uniref:Uncharacterized protein n=1 Tax=Vermiconidia calcicola TaxID=1690605 RepID=A0ACC3NX45_9PEZI|nr:hypothetical protein LTR37_000915 [Vermiconidia calcicola]